MSTNEIYTKWIKYPPSCRTHRFVREFTLDYEYKYCVYCGALRDFVFYGKNT